MNVRRQNFMISPSLRQMARDLPQLGCPVLPEEDSPGGALSLEDSSESRLIIRSDLYAVLFLDFTLLNRGRRIDIHEWSIALQVEEPFSCDLLPRRNIHARFFADSRLGSIPAAEIFNEQTLLLRSRSRKSLKLIATVWGNLPTLRGCRRITVELAAIDALKDEHPLILEVPIERVKEKAVSRGPRTPLFKESTTGGLFEREQEAIAPVSPLPPGAGQLSDVLLSRLGQKIKDGAHQE